MARTKKPVTKRTPNTKEEFSITLSIGNDTYSGSGSSMVEALISLPKPDKNMAKGVVTVAHGKLNKTFPVTPLLINRLFFTGTSLREVRAKQLSMGLR